MVCCQKSTADVQITVAHLILVQNRRIKIQTHLIHWDRWPILGKFRACMFQNPATVQKIMWHLGVRTPRAFSGLQFAMHT